ncbi:uncharacterized protein LOC125955356 [Anopheles darlingi]|uniref:uncharacterized protein LOC125955356 n=1 Tax=Anopheles darlingi TaxID=43151 RepID=UPI0021001341|nr:uncharacterized protein LOC125955356 [Anopheles darlingi]
MLFPSSRASSSTKGGGDVTALKTISTGSPTSRYREPSTHETIFDDRVHHKRRDFTRTQRTFRTSRDAVPAATILDGTTSSILRILNGRGFTRTQRTFITISDAVPTATILDGTTSSILRILNGRVLPELNGRSSPSATPYLQRRSWVEQHRREVGSTTANGSHGKDTSEDRQGQAMTNVENSIKIVRIRINEASLSMKLSQLSRAVPL